MSEQIHTDALTIHRTLWNPPHGKHYTGPEGLAMADNNHADARDRPLKEALRLRLGVSDFHEKSLSGKSAQDYMTAFLEALEPLAEIYRDICEYARRSNLRQSEHSQALAWDFTFGGVTVELNLEHFRRYKTMLDELPDERAFRGFWKRFLDATCKACPYRADIMQRTDNADPGPTARTELREIYREMSRVWALPDDERHARFPEAVEIQFLFRRLKANPASLQSPFFEGMSLPILRHATLEPEDVLELPFWKFRWQVYEIWTTVTSLSVLEPYGFALAFAANGKSLLEQGARAMVAMREAAPAAYAYVQPTYLNHNGDTVHPDLVVSRCADINALAAANVDLVVEAKQRKRSLTHEWSRKENFEGALRRYAAATAAGGVVLLNYDDLPDSLSVPSTAAALGHFHPGPGFDSTALARAMAPHLQAYADLPAGSERDLVVIDYSSSMGSVFRRATSLLKTQLAQFGGATLLYATVGEWFAEVTQADVESNNMPPKFQEAENPTTLAAGVNAILSHHRIRHAVFITDLANPALATFMDEYVDAGGSPRLRVLQC